MIRHKSAWSPSFSVLPRRFTLSFCLSLNTQIYTIASWASFAVLPLPSAFDALHLIIISNCECRMLSSRAGHPTQSDVISVSGNYDNVINRCSVKSNCGQLAHCARQCSNFLSWHPSSQHYCNEQLALAALAQHVFPRQKYSDTRLANLSFKSTVKNVNHAYTRLPTTAFALLDATVLFRD